VAERARLRGEIAVGVQGAAHRGLGLSRNRNPFGVTLNPPRGRRVALRQGDRVVVLGDAL